MTPSATSLARNRHHPLLRRLLIAAIATADTTEQTATEDVAGDEAVTSIDDEGTTSFDDEQLVTELDDPPLTTLSEADRDGLIFMREEEKLALDVYQELYDVWGLRIFDNISKAEQTHTDSVRTLLDRYDISDPAFDQPAGVFTNADLQALYDELVASGSESTTEALLVGALIGDLDIADLQARASDEAAIALVYSNLEKGFRNHLRAFMGQLDANDTAYTPSYISQDDFDAIIASPVERGNGR